MLTDERLVKKIITPRPAESHKGTFGRVVLIGGNEQYGGAIIMSALATVKSGAGLTTVITAPKNHAPLHAHLPEAMCVDWHDTQMILSTITSADILLVGPGLGTTSESFTLLELILANQSENQWLIMDGSALTLFAEKKLKLPFPKQTVFTPHQMEWQKITSLSISEQTKEKNRKKQQELGTTVVLKSHQTAIYGQETFYQNTVGSAAMATGGMGDTLAGMIAGFLAQFPKNDQTIAAAVYLHSYIGDHLAKSHYVVLPTQISQQLPMWMHHFSQIN